MAYLQRFFGGPPRMELLEALLHVAPVAFKRADLAREAGISKGNANRVFPALEQDGLVVRVGGGKQPLYRVNSESPHIRILHHLVAALQLIEAGSDEEGEQVAESFRKGAVDVVRARPVDPTRH